MPGKLPSHVPGKSPWYPTEKQEEERRQREHREKCPGCDKWVTRDPRKAGPNESCPHCGHSFQVKEASLQKWASGWNHPSLPGQVFSSKKALLKKIKPQ